MWYVSAKNEYKSIPRHYAYVFSLFEITRHFPSLDMITKTAPNQSRQSNSSQLLILTCLSSLWPSTARLSRTQDIAEWNGISRHKQLEGECEQYGYVHQRQKALWINSYSKIRVSQLASYHRNIVNIWTGLNSSQLKRTHISPLFFFKKRLTKLQFLQHNFTLFLVNVDFLLNYS